MRKSILILPLVLFILVSASNVQAQDGFFSNARTFEEGTFALGLQPVMLTSQDDFMFIGRAEYGVSHGLTGHFKVGFQDNETYVGAHFEGSLASEPQSALSVALLGGVYSYNDVGLKVGMNISKNFHPVSIYSGLNYQPLFVSNGTINSWLVPIGMDIHLKRGTLDLLLEGNIPLNDEAEYLEAVSFGARIYLN